MIVVGVDAARAPGWVAVTLRDGRLSSMVLHPSLEAVIEAEPDAVAFGVDVPIGHEDPTGSLAGGRRQCDKAARAFLPSARQASVFWVPPTSVLSLADQTEAVEECRRRGWIAPSAQVWAMRARLLEARAFAKDPRIFEVHPEVSFQVALEEQGSPRRTMEHPKTTWSGLVERLEVLHTARLRPERSLGGIGRASPDDVLDATIAAWTAQRIASGAARKFPAGAPVDPETGRPVAVWA